MLRAMDSAVSGLRAHQNKLDVIGHNIANVNTYGFKSQSYTFKDTMYQTSTASTNGTATAGGVNAAQYGYGALMGVISMDMTASTPTYKGGFNATIDGDGFFITKSTKDDTGITGITSSVADTDKLKGSDLEFTRVGQFTVDSNGFVTDGNGNFVYGFRMVNNEVDDTTLRALRVPTGGGDLELVDGQLRIKQTTDAIGQELEAISIQVNKMGDIQVSVKVQYLTTTDNTTNPPTVTNTVLRADGKLPNGNAPTVDANNVINENTFTVKMGQLALATFQNQEGLTKNGNGYYTATPSDNTGVCSAGIPGDGRATLMPGYLEASNVDLATEFSDMITTERGFQANSKIITVSDEILSDLINMKR